MNNRLESVYQWLTCWLVLFTVTIAVAFYQDVRTIDERLTKLERICHGQCTTGNSIERHDCKMLCDKRGKCPMSNTQDGD